MTAVGAQFRRQRLAEVVVDLLAASLPATPAIVVDDAHWLDETSIGLLGRVAAAAAERGWSMVVMWRDEPGATRRGRRSGWRSGPGRRRRHGRRGRRHRRRRSGRTRSPRSSIGPAAARSTCSSWCGWCGPGAPSRACPSRSTPPSPPRSTAYHPCPGGSSDWRRCWSDLPAAGARRAARVSGSRSMRRRRCSSARSSSATAPWSCASAALLQEAALRGLPYQRRRQIHALAGEAIERLNADAPDRAADVLGLHYERGFHYAKAWRYARTPGMPRPTPTPMPRPRCTTSSPGGGPPAAGGERPRSGSGLGQPRRRPRAGRRLRPRPRRVPARRSAGARRPRGPGVHAAQAGARPRALGGVQPGPRRRHRRPAPPRSHGRRHRRRPLAGASAHVPSCCPPGSGSHAGRSRSPSRRQPWRPGRRPSLGRLRR